MTLFDAHDAGGVNVVVRAIVTVGCIATVMGSEVAEDGSATPISVAWRTCRLAPAMISEVFGVESPLACSFA